MDIISILIFFIYTLVILMMLIYVSPILSAVVMIIVPLASVYLMPGSSMQFLSTLQFSFAAPVYNIHILLMIWSAFIGITAYAEVLSWYLLRETRPKQTVKPVPDASKPKETPKPGNKIGAFFQKFVKLMMGKKE